MAEAARHVNTMEAHHAPNWSRKHHVDGAHDKPSATSGSHGRRPHNATKPKTKHAPIDNESWSHADARAARLGRTESLSGYLFGSAFSAPERQRPAEENRRLWPEEHDEDAATYFTPFDEGRSGVRPDGPETTSTGENKFHLEFQGNHEPHDGECEAVRLPGEDHRPIDEDEPLYAGNVRLAEVLGERKESFDLTPRFYGPDEARAHVLERDEPQPEFDVAGHVRLKPALHEDKPDLLAELVENGLKEGLKLRMDHLDAIDDEVAAIYAEPAVVAKVPTREELEQRHPSLPPPIYSDRFSTHGTRPHDPHERDVQSILKGPGTKEEKAIAINQLDVPQETKNRALQDLENDNKIEDAERPAGVPDDRRSVHAADRYGKNPTEAKRVPLAAQHSRATLEKMTQNDEGLEAETLETSRDGQRLQTMRKPPPLAAVPEDAAAAPVPVEPLTPEAAVDRPEPALTARVASLRPSPADEEKEPEFGGAGLAAAKARDEEKEERRRRRKKKKKSESKDDASADSKRKRKHKSSKKKRESSSSAAAPAVVVADAPAPAEAPGPTAEQAAPGDESTCVIA